MLHCVREGDTVARIGGDEFMVLLPEITGEAGAIAIAEAIHQSLNQTGSFKQLPAHQTIHKKSYS
ncbi:diguanylate cyclase domain-containing protein, partial [Aeromonas salmonicida]|uniref:diguanylate cyclase domain-containing protein n=1 Tax=Aeromonas salmonicida TaxID=645 RepID=UPI003D317D96